MTALVMHILPLLGIRPGLAYYQVMEMLAILHALGNCWRLASSGVCSSVVCGRFTFGFCTAMCRRVRQAAAG